MTVSSWMSFGLGVVCLIGATAIFGLQLRNDVSWDVWWVPCVLAFAAPLGLLASYALSGDTMRGVGVAVAAWAILCALGALGVYAGMSGDRPGEAIALLLMVGTTLTLLLAGWAGWDLARRAHGAPPITTD